MFIKLPEDNLSILDLRGAWDRKTVRYMSETGEQGGSGEGSSGEGEGEGSSGAGAGDGSEGKKPDEPVISDPEKKRLSDEAAGHRVKLRETEGKLNEALSKLREIEDKDKSELEKAQRDLTEAQATIEKLSQLVQDQALKVAWVESGAAALFKNPGVAFKLLDTSKVKVDDGVADGKAIKELADALAKSGDVVLANASDGTGDERSPSGAPTNGKTPSGKEATKAELERRFPALKSRQAS